MESKILDEPIEEKIKNQSHLLIIPLLILWAAVTWSFFAQNSFFLIAASLTVASTLLYFISENMCFWLITTTLFLGVIKIIYIFPVQILLEILGVEFDIICLLALGITLFLNRRRVEELISSTLPDKELELSRKKSKIDGYKQRFSRKSDNQLEQKLNNPSLVDEAKIAAKEVLKERSF